MGTWGAPATKEEKKELKKRLKELQALHDEISALFGDDILSDAFTEAENRIKFGIKAKWIVPSFDE